MNEEMKFTRLSHRASRDGYIVGLCFCFGALSLSAAAIDESQLPAPATNQIDFLRDIKPILDSFCTKCHGPERPKSKFRVDDRGALLKGGENGVDVIPGQSGKSPLIHYVARLVEDMEMPPVGKGEPLTKEQIALLRAWIDQGVTWAPLEPVAREEFSVSPMFRWITVDGNERKFREHNWTKEGVSIGLEEFSLKKQIDANRNWLVTGRALREDYKVSLSLERKEVGFTRIGWEEYRKYFDDSGGYYENFTPPAFELDRNLYLDIGKFWAEVGLTLPARPRLVLGYEYQYHEGAKSLLQWLPETQGGNTRNIFPTAKEIDQRLHVIRLDATHEIRGFLLEDNFRYEIFELDTSRRIVSRQRTNRDRFLEISEGQDHHQLANAFRFEKQVTDWLLVSAGHLYRRLEGEASFTHTTTDSSGNPAVGQFWNATGIVLEQSSHTFNFNSQLGPWQGFTFSAGVQSEWGRQEGLGEVDLAFGDPNAPVPFPATVSASLDRFSTDENFALRYTTIPFTVLFADARFKQQQISQFEDQVGDIVMGDQDFLRDTDACEDWKEYRGGFHFSPQPRVALNAHYLHRTRSSEYDHERDALLGQSPGPGYSAFIRARDICTDGVETKLVVRPMAWLKSTFGYKLLTTDYETATDAAFSTLGGTVLAGNYDAHVWTANLTFTPWRRLYLSTTFSFQKTRTETEDNGNASVVPYCGETYGALSSANYALNEKTALYASYHFSSADYAQDNEAAGLPLGIEYERHGIQVGLGRQLHKNFRMNLQYSYYFYEEPSQGSQSDYTAHALFATLMMKWP